MELKALEKGAQLCYKKVTVIVSTVGAYYVNVFMRFGDQFYKRMEFFEDEGLLIRENGISFLMRMAEPPPRVALGLSVRIIL